MLVLSPGLTECAKTLPDVFLKFWEGNIANLRRKIVLRTATYLSSSGLVSSECAWSLKSDIQCGKGSEKYVVEDEQLFTTIVTYLIFVFSAALYSDITLLVSKTS